MTVAFFNQPMSLTIEECDSEIAKIWKMIKSAPLSQENPARRHRIDVYLDARLQIQKEAEMELVGDPQ